MFKVVDKILRNLTMEEPTMKNLKKMLDNLSKTKKTKKSDNRYKSVNQKLRPTCQMD